MYDFHQMLYDLLVKSYVECRHDEVETKGWMECWVGETAWVGGHGMVGEQGGVVRRGGIE